MYVVLDRVLPYAVAILAPQHCHFGTVCGYFSDCDIVELKDILYHFVFGFAYGAVLASRVSHKAYILLRHSGILGVRVDTEHAKHAVSRNGEQPHQRLEGDRDAVDGPRKTERYSLGILHGKSFGHELAEYERNV